MVISVEERVSGGAYCEITAARVNQDVQLKHKGNTLYLQVYMK